MSAETGTSAGALPWSERIRWTREPPKKLVEGEPGNKTTPIGHGVVNFASRCGIKLYAGKALENSCMYCTARSTPVRDVEGTFGRL